jgi:AraC-like DNA-binding protein
MAPASVACYREFAPHPALEGLIRAWFSFVPKPETVPACRRITREVVFGPGDPFSAPLFADGNSSLVVRFGRSCHADGSWKRNLPGAHGVVIGAVSRVDAVPDGELPEMIGAYFHPARVASFAHVPAEELTDRIVALEDLWGASGRELPARLDEMGESARIDGLESVLLRRIRAGSEPAGTVNVAGLAAWVLQGRGRMSVERLAEAAGVSRQHLTRVFRERVGVSPKLYSRLARFQSALVYAVVGRKVDWARASAELGYADQSHMIADFREFSGLTPERLSSGRWFHPFIERAIAAQPTRGGGESLGR